VERIVSQARELRETAGGREVSFEVQGEADQRIRVRLAIHEDRSLRVSFDTGDQGVVHALRERVEILRGRLQECGFDATEVSFRGWDTSAGTSAGTGEMRSDRGDEHGTAPREEDDLAQVVPGAARANGPRPAMGEAEATRTRPGDGRLSWVA
jgi:hypothetical protein